MRDLRAAGLRLRNHQRSGTVGDERRNLRRGRAERLYPIFDEADEAPATYDANGVKLAGAGTVVVVLPTVVYAVYSGSLVEVVVAPTVIVMMLVKM